MADGLTNDDLANDDLAPEQFLPCFRSRRMNQWSLGVDGHSQVQRDLVGRPIGRPAIRRLIQSMRDAMSRRSRQPKVMVSEWSEDFLQVIHQFKPERGDRILVNTTDDFVMLGLANALQRCRKEHPLQIDVIFHFALYAADQIDRRAIAFGRQVNDALTRVQPHQVSLFATTKSLTRQLENVGITAAPVPYPTRRRKVVPESTEVNRPLKILMAGMPRAEKGREQISTVLSSIHDPYLTSRQFTFSMQMRPKGWKHLIPGPLHSDYVAAVSDKKSTDTALEIVSSNLPGDKYHQWLSTADVGLFLYDPVRYVARCSGVLLEMFVRGVPVIVPEGCWLADQVQAAGGDGSVGYIYERIDQIPRLLSQVRIEHAGLRRRAVEFASVIVERHSGENTMRTIGLGQGQIQNRVGRLSRMAS
ncbi:MAG: hypothetical protein HKN47_04995 [Pirellulaceae bacterium]|nr:hypothetical protein [Pirellulaceae bacterium]